MNWKLSEWNGIYTTVKEPMTKGEIDKAIKQLRSNNYPKPTDCHEEKCPKFRPACHLGICNIAVGMCGDF